MPHPSQDSIELLKRKRTSLRAATTRVINEIGALLTSYPSEIGELEEKPDILLIKEASLKEFDKEIEAVVEDEALEEEVSGAEGYAERISVAKTRVKRKFKEHETRNNTASGFLTRGSDSGQPLFNHALTTVRLPKLEIVKYGGDIRLWPGFWGQFNSAIHQKEYLSDIDKFKYLKRYLIGRAAVAIEELPLTTENYQVALDLLTQRFGQTELIVEDHMSRLMAVRAVPDSRNVERLKTLYDQIETGVSSLEALGVEEKTYGVVLLTAFGKAIPADIGLKYSREVIAQSMNRENKQRGFLSFFLSNRLRSQRSTRRHFVGFVVAFPPKVEILRSSSLSILGCSLSDMSRRTNVR